ncbi:MAG TPA: ABC transporter ATP-binding protein [Kineosporiaceae bacterium]
MDARSSAPGAGIRGIGRLYADLGALTRGRRIQVFVVFAGLAVSRLFKLSGPLLFAVGVNYLERDRGRDLTVPSLCLAGIGLSALAYLVTYLPARTGERFLALEVRRAYTDRLYRRLVRLPLTWHEQHHSGELGHRVRTSAEALFEFAQSQAFYIETIVTIVGTVTTLLFFNVWTAVLAAVGYGSIFVMLIGIDGPVVSAMRTQNEAEARLTAEITDHTGNIMSVLTLGLQDHARRLLRRRMRDVVSSRRLVIRLQQRKWASVDVVIETLWCALVGVAAWSSARTSGTVAVGTVVLVGQYANSMSTAVLSGVNYWQQLLEYSAKYQNAEPLHSAAQEEADETDGPSGWRTLELRNLTVEHAARDMSDPLAEPAGLRDVTLRLRRGERIALVGPSGAGKSTLLRALAGMHVAASGHAVVDGTIVPDLRSLRGTCILIPQEAEIFATTIRENLTLSGGTGSERIREICRISALDEVLAELPDGLDTHLAERGQNLSGGQRQRISLARGLLAVRGHSLVLLDEPTSSLDPVTEQHVYTSILQRFTSACIVSSVHRLDLLVNFDRVVLMEDGCVIDVGTPQELLARQSLFRTLWTRGTTSLRSAA